MWNVRIELEAFNRAVADARAVHERTAEFCRAQRALVAPALAERKSTLTGVAPQAGGPRAWAPLVAAGLAPRPNGRRSGVER